MTIKELKEQLAIYSDDAEFVVNVNDNQCEHLYTSKLYDMNIIGDRDDPPNYQIGFERKRNPGSTKVSLRIYR